MAESTGRGVPQLDDTTMVKLADLLLSRVPGRPGVLPIGGGTRVQSFRGKNQGQLGCPRALNMPRTEICIEGSSLVYYFSIYTTGDLLGCVPSLQ